MIRVPRLPLSFSILDLQRIFSVLSLSIEFFLLYPKRLEKKAFPFSQALLLFDTSVSWSAFLILLFLVLLFSVRLFLVLAILSTNYFTLLRDLRVILGFKSLSLITGLSKWYLDGRLEMIFSVLREFVMCTVISILYPMLQVIKTILSVTNLIRKLLWRFRIVWRYEEINSIVFPTGASVW